MFNTEGFPIVLQGLLRFSLYSLRLLTAISEIEIHCGMPCFICFSSFKSFLL